MADREPYPPEAPDAASSTRASSTDAATSPGAAAPRRRGWLRALLSRLLALTLGLVVALLLAEVATRLLSDEGPAWTFRDPEIGRRFARSWEGKAWVEEAGHAVHLSFNREGMRDRDWPEEVGWARVAVLGDSMVAALATERSRRFADASQGLAELTDPGVASGMTPLEIQNWGVAGSSPSFELLLYERRVRRYKPHAVVLCWFSGNDLSDDWQPLGGRRQAWLELDADGSLVRKPLETGGSGLSEWLACHSRFYVWQRRMLARLRSSREDERVLRPGLQAFADPDVGEVARAWTMQERIFDAFAKAVRADGAQPLLVVLPCAEQIYDDLWEQTAARAQAQGLDLSRERLPRRIAQAARAADLPCFDLVEDFRAAAPAHSLARTEEHLFLGGTGHLNDAGHRTATKGLGRAIASCRLPSEHR